MPCHAKANGTWLLGGSPDGAMIRMSEISLNASVRMTDFMPKSAIFDGLAPVSARTPFGKAGRKVTDGGRLRI